MNTEMIESINEIDQAKKYNKIFDRIKYDLSCLSAFVAENDDVLTFSTIITVSDFVTLKFKTGRSYNYGYEIDILNLLKDVKEFIHENKGKDNFVNI